MGFFDSLKVKKNVIGISISPKGVLEVAEYDIDSKKILKYSNAAINYNISARQIEDTVELENAIRKCFEETGINHNAPVYLSLPTTLISHQTLPNILDDDSIKMALASESEKNYIFKKNEPLISYYKISENEETETSFLAYSAFQAEMIQQIKEMCDRIGLKIISIDTSYSAMIRGLTESTIINSDLLESASWNVVLINTNSYVIFSMVGDRLFEVFEDPLAIKSFSEDEIYPAITAAVSSNITNFAAEHLVIISESDDVSAELLSNYLNTGSPKTAIENNRYSREAFINYDLNVLPSKAPAISPEIVGVCAWGKESQEKKFNFLSDTSVREIGSQSILFMGKEIEITPKLLQNIMLGYIGTCLVLVGLFWYIAESVNSVQDKSLQELSVRQSELETALKADDSKGKAMPEDFVKEIYNYNKNLITSYDSISIDIPEKLWIEDLEIYNDMTGYIKGKAYNMEDILNYYESVQKLSKFKDLKISTLRVFDPTTAAISDKDAKVADSSTSQTPTSSANTNELPKLSEISLNAISGEKTYEFIFGQKKTTEQQTVDAAAGAQTSPTAPGGPNPAGPPDASMMAPNRKAP